MIDLSRQSSRQSSIASTALPPYSPARASRLSISNFFATFRGSSSSLPMYESGAILPRTALESAATGSQSGKIANSRIIGEPEARAIERRPLPRVPNVNAIDREEFAIGQEGSQMAIPPAFPADKQRPPRGPHRERLLLRPTVYDGTLAGLTTREELEAATLLLFPTEKRRTELSSELMFIPPPAPLSPPHGRFFSTSLFSSTGHQWATLHLDAPLISKLDLPTYQTGSRICGRLELDFPSRRDVRFIELVLKGTITVEAWTGIPVANDYKENFLSRRSILWAPEMGDVRQLIHHSGSSSTLDLAQVHQVNIRTSSGEPRSSQDVSYFIGLVDIPFEFPFPAITERGTRNPEYLPPSVEMNTSAKIEYSLATVVHFDGFPSKSERISTTLNVLPRPQEKRVPRSRRTRALAKPATYRGISVDSSETFEVTCKMLYPQPAVFAAGECISLHIQLACQQENADHILDLLCSDYAVTVCLTRAMSFAHLDDTKCVAMGLCWTSESDNNVATSREETRSTESALGGETWEGEGHRNNLRCRVVHCELRLPSDIMPSFKFRDVESSYKICLLSFRHSRILSTSFTELIGIPISVIANPTQAFQQRFVSKAPSNLAVPELLPSEDIPRRHGMALRLESEDVQFTAASLAFFETDIWGSEARENSGWCDWIFTEFGDADAGKSRRTLFSTFISSSPSMFSSRIYTDEDVKAHADGRSCWISRNGKVYDVTKFLSDHPGGDDLILKFAGEDIGDAMRDKDEHDHSDSAYEMLEEYCIGRLGADAGIVSDDWVPTETFHPENTDTADDFKKCQFLDLRYPLLKQIWFSNFSKSFYLRQVHQPRHVPESAALFGGPIEFLTRTEWYVVPIVWLPIAISLFIRSLQQFSTPSIPISSLPFPDPTGLHLIRTTALPKAATCFFIGNVIWTILEYLLHRFLFHVDEWLPDKPIFLTLHFLLHGVHHYLPMDRLRLVMPPILFFLLSYPFTRLAYAIFPTPIANGIISGAFAFYVLYDCMHYALHHTKLPAYMREMKKYHLAHHYKNFELGFGVTSKVWDYVFNTMLPV